MHTHPPHALSLSLSLSRGWRLAPQFLVRGGLSATAVCLAAALAASQSPVNPCDSHPLPVRDDYVFHVYVDPLFGDDAQAWNSNPSPGFGVNPGTNPNPLDKHPSFRSTMPASRYIGGLLQHAPYSFKTLTGAKGAIKYVGMLFPLNQGPPWLRVNTCVGDDQKQVQWIVIHCLPGLYGPTEDENGQPLTVLDPESGLPYNGETFPVDLSRDQVAGPLVRVALQGTSALDTIFDARRLKTCVIRAGGLQVSPQSGTLLRQYCFVDSLTIRGARSDGAPQPTEPGERNCTGAGIFLALQESVWVTEAG